MRRIAIELTAVLTPAEGGGYVALNPETGSHIIMPRGASGCVVPTHGEVKVGTLAGLLRQGGVSADEFMQTM